MNPFQKSETLGRLKLKRHSNELNFNNLTDSEGIFCSYDMENDSLLVEVKDREIPWSKFKDAILEVPKYNKLMEYSQKLNKDAYYVMFFTDDIVVKINVNQLEVDLIKPNTVMANKTTAVNTGKRLKEWYNIKQGMAGVEVIKLTI